MDFKKAARLRSAIKNNPSDTGLLKEAAEYFQSVELLDEALEYWLRYSKIIEDDSTAFRFIGAIYGSKGKFEDAVNSLTRSLDLNPDDANTHYNYALAVLNLGNINEAVKHFTKSLELVPDDAECWNDLGVLLFTIEKKDEAEDCFYKAISINPEFRNAYINLGQFDGSFKNKEKTIELFRTFLISNQDNEILQIFNKFKPKDDPMVRYKGFKVSLSAFSDIESDPQRQLRWGDYWFKKEFSEAFERLGCEIVEDNSDLNMHLFGVPMDSLPKASNHAIWIHSHPDIVSAPLLQKYDKIFCLSKRFIPKIKKMGFKAELLIGGTAKKPVKSDKKYDLVFVGNTKGITGRKIIRDLKGSYTGLKVWGEGWESILPGENIGGLYYENQKLPELYASSKISLNDHHDDMSREGFLNPRIFDILASGGFVISDKIAGMDEIFDGAVPSYSTPDELHSLIEKYLKDDEAREVLAQKGLRVSQKYTFDRMALQVLNSVFPRERAGKSKSISMKRIAENAIVNKKQKGSINISLDADKCSKYELFPVLNALKLISDNSEKFTIQLKGKPDCSLPKWTQNCDWIEPVDEFKSCDLSIDSKLKYSSHQESGLEVPVILTPNTEDNFVVKDDKLRIKIETQIDMDRGRIWKYNDLAFKMGFAIDNYETLLTKVSSKNE